MQVSSNGPKYYFTGIVAGVVVLLTVLFFVMSTSPRFSHAPGTPFTPRNQIVKETQPTTSTVFYVPPPDLDRGLSTSSLERVLDQPVTPPPTNPALQAPTSSIQYVLLAFDGSRSPDMWQKTLDFAREMKSQNAPVHFTYFISGVYFIPASNKMAYLSPGHATGTSAIGWGIGPNEIGTRIGYVNQAIADGHEIGSHANGHFDGSKWTEAQWDSEFDQFHKFTENTSNYVDLSKQPTEKQKINYPQSRAVGFRAPELGQDPALFKVLQKYQYLYDCSRTRKSTDQPYKTPEGVWEIGLSRINYASTTSQILSMDYNFYFKQSGAKDTAKKGTPEWQVMYNDMLTSYRRYFDVNYNGPHAPVSIGHHFSEWNDGVYWEVMKQFAREVCGKSDVRCISHEEYARILEAEATKK